MSEQLAEYLDMPEAVPDSVLKASVYTALARGSDPAKVLLWFGPQAAPFIEEYPR